MEQFHLPQNEPAKKGALRRVDLDKMDDITKQINERALRASRIEQKLSDKSLSSEKILELEEEKARIIDQVRDLSQRRAELYKEKPPKSN